MKSLENMLYDYEQTDYYPFHMPGHKRNIEKFGAMLPYHIDITEIEGFDDLHHSEDIFIKMQRDAATLFQAEESHFLINGSTVGILSAILATTSYGDTILVARNCHKSVYNAIMLNNLKPIYIYPKLNEEYLINDEVQASDIEKILENECNIKAVVIVSPTYEGVISNVKEIASIVHKKGIPLIVDEAHGAHLGLHDKLHQNANQQGADIVIQSLHKTLPSLTQTAILHMNGELANRKRVKRYLTMLQSSSPSYVLLASIDQCVKMLIDEKKVLFKEYIENILDLRQHLRELKYIKLVETEHYDITKVVLSTIYTQLTSQELYGILLEKYHLQMEMVGESYIIAMTTIGDTQEGLRRLLYALQEVDRQVEQKTLNQVLEYRSKVKNLVTLPRLKYNIDDPNSSEWFYYLYPPGIPIITPGEIITAEVEQKLQEYKEYNFEVKRG